MVDAPMHMAEVPPVMLKVGSAFTVMVRVAVLLQPAALVPVTVYVVVVVGVQVTCVPVEVFNVTAGDQE